MTALVILAALTWATLTTLLIAICQTGAATDRQEGRRP